MATTGVNRLRVLLVDDEALALKRLQRMLDGVQTVNVIATASTVPAALAVCRQQSPDVILLDVEMPGPSGLDLAAELMNMRPRPAVIFTTAYEDYAVQAFGVEATDYLVKPVRAARLQAALARVTPQPRPARAMLTARLGERVQCIPVEDVRVLQATDKYTQVHHVGGNTLVDDSLVALQREFPHRWVRVHRATLISRAHIAELFRDEHGCIRVRLRGCELEPAVSRRNLPELRRLLRTGQ